QPTRTRRIRADPTESLLARAVDHVRARAVDSDSHAMAVDTPTCRRTANRILEPMDARVIALHKIVRGVQFACRCEDLGQLARWLLRSPRCHAHQPRGAT